MMTTASHLCIGPFTLTLKLAESGMASLYRALAGPGKPVVVKVSHVAGDEATIFKDLLKREAEILSELRHPGIVRLYSFSLDGGDPQIAACAPELDGEPWYFSMEYLPGGSLGDLIRTSHDQFSLDWWVELFYQVVIILDYAHGRKVAWGDAKPEHVLFRFLPDPEAQPWPVLIDWGTWSEADHLTSDPAGSVEYAAPELLVLLGTTGSVLRESVVPETFDIWALGCLFFEMLTGTPLIRAAGAHEALETIVSSRLPAISDFRRDSPPGYDVMLEAMLDRNAAERPTTLQIIAALEKLSRLPRLPVR